MCNTRDTMPAMADPDQPRIIRFGLFELDKRTGELRKNGSRIKLQEQPKDGKNSIEWAIPSPGGKLLAITNTPESLAPGLSGKLLTLRSVPLRSSGRPRICLCGAQAEPFFTSTARVPIPDRSLRFTGHWSLRPLVTRLPHCCPRNQSLHNPCSAPAPAPYFPHACPR